MDERYAQLGLATAAQRLAQAGRSTPSGSRADGESAIAASMARMAEQAADGLGLDADLLHLAAEVAALQTDLDSQRRLALIILIAASVSALNQGSTRLAVAELRPAGALERLIAPLVEAALGEDRVDEVIARIERMLSERQAPMVIGWKPDHFRPLIYRPPYLYHQRIFAAEQRTAAMLAQRLGEPPSGPLMEAPLRAAIEDIQARPSRLPDHLGQRGAELALSEEQLGAISAAARYRMALVSGGPGTGKTSIVMAILRVLVRMGLAPEEIALAAPTGKAAYRLGESIRAGLARIDSPSANDRALFERCPPPATIHRLLGYSPSSGRLRFTRSNPLLAAAVVIDESSMLDLVLMEQLLAAVPPTARFIMLGDTDQLPSVEAGAIFRDLAATAGRLGPDCCIKLSRSYRMASDQPSGALLGDLAQTINSGASLDADRLARVRRASAADLRFEGVEFLSPANGDLEELLDRWFSERVWPEHYERLVNEVYAEEAAGFAPPAQAQIERLFDWMAASRVLCVTRAFATGTDSINASLHRRVPQARAGDVSWRAFVAGEPVMVIRNDYQRMLFNGDQGVILRVRRPASRPTLMAVFRRREGLAAFHLEALRDLVQLCYATTVHKAQGAEFDSTALVLPDRLVPLLTREVLYTAVTRSRRSTVIVGSETIFSAGAARRLERDTGLGEEVTRLLSHPKPAA